MGRSHKPSAGRRVLRGVGRSPLTEAEKRARALVTMAALVALAAGGLAESSHVVGRGENLTVIARKYGSTPRAIAQFNSLPNPNLILIGQMLRIPGQAAPGAPAPTVPVAATVHTVVPGENLTRIAAAYGTTVREIVAANQLSNPNFVRAGSRLVVPRPGPATVEDLLAAFGAKHGVDPALVKGVAWQESGWKQEVVSSAGAVGVMQVMPETGVFIGSHLLGRPVDLNNVEHNIEAGVRFLAYLLSQTGGDERLAIAGYYQGLRSVNQQGMFPSTERFVANVLALKQRFG